MFLSNRNSVRNAERNERLLTTLGERRRTSKQKDPERFARNMTQDMIDSNPDREKELNEKLERYLSNLYRDSLDSQKQ